jgi:hypothetical protein
MNIQVRRISRNSGVTIDGFLRGTQLHELTIIIAMNLNILNYYTIIIIKTGAVFITSTASREHGS